MDSASTAKQRTARLDLSEAFATLQRDALELGFQRAAVARLELGEDVRHLERWLAAGFHGEMDYMSRHAALRAQPQRLVPDTVSIVTLRMDYLPEPADAALAALERRERGYVSRYALGRDYHKILRTRLVALARRLAERVGPFGYRVFTDSAPVLERALARNGGLGWIGKHTNLVNRHDGSLFLLGEIFTDLPLPADDGHESDLCGTCTRCIDVCPTGAIVAPYTLDARRCISYLTIEHKGSIPEPLRPMLGNRVFGCDDCQLVCPWNRYAKLTRCADFAARHDLDTASLVTMFGWSADEYGRMTEGSALRRVKHPQWLRNVAVALGNAPTTPAVIDALGARAADPDPLVREHVAWALARHGG